MLTYRLQGLLTTIWQTVFAEKTNNNITSCYKKPTGTFRVPVGIPIGIVHDCNTAITSLNGE